MASARYTDADAPVDSRGDLRELVISHGSSGYSALYRVRADNVVVLAIRHQREAGFQ